jgi:hypothetical protein
MAFELCDSIDKRFGPFLSGLGIISGDEGFRLQCAVYSASRPAKFHRFGLLRSALRALDSVML